MPRRHSAPLHIDRGVYAMERSGDAAELTVYGEIVTQRPTDRNGEPLKGDYIVQSEFLEDLEKLAGARSLTIRMHSFGGDAGASILIHNRLRELAAKGTALTCVVDGVAASGGSLIMCACGTVKVNAASLVMIHNALVGLLGGYNAGELQHLTTVAETWDKAQISIYRRKTGLPEPEIARMMADTTYLTGAEAVEKGFADELIEDAEPVKIAASADGRSLIVNGRPFRLTPGLFAPDSIPTASPEAKVTADDTKDNPKTEGGTNMASTLEELRAEYPELTAQLEAEASAKREKSERQRLSEIDAVASLYDAETVREAKYGETACTAQEMAYRAAQKAVAQGRKALADMEADAKTSGAETVGGTPPPADSGGKNPIAQAKADARAYNERKKEVR